MKKIILSICVFSFLVACSNNSRIEWVVTTPDISWQKQDVRKIEFVEDDEVDVDVDVIIDINNPKQTIEGFGACFNELGWTSLALLNDEDRQSIMHEMFTPGVGANFTICRMPIGANDFSRDWYSYNETDGDFEMKNFSIANDQETLIPFIREALRYNPNLKIWASPWSPPVWMKDNKHYACKPLDTSFFNSIGENNIKPDQVRQEGMNMFIQDQRYFKAYSLYFKKFIEAYRTENIDIFMVMPQNEFNSCQPFPSCTWQANALSTFVGKYLGPEMHKIGVDIMFGTMERPNPSLVDTILTDSESKKYISGIGFQWAGKYSVRDLHERYPDLKIYQTEQECGNGKNDWKGCVYSWSLLHHFLNCGTNVYEYWNISLEEGGLSRWGWSQNSLVTVDKVNKTYKYTYEYYLLKHVSHYVLPGAKLLPVNGESSDMLSFQNKDGSFVLIIYNVDDIEKKYNIKMGERLISILVQPNSINTIRL